MLIKVSERLFKGLMQHSSQVEVKQHHVAVCSISIGLPDSAVKEVTNVLSPHCKSSGYQNADQ